MDKIAELRAKRAEAANAYAALVDKMGAEDYAVEHETKDEETLETLKSEISETERKIARVEEANKLKASLAKPVEAVATVPAVKVSSPGYRGQKLVAFKSEEAAFKTGMWLTANFSKSEKERVAASERCKEWGIQKYQAEGINTAGGFLVPTEFESAVIDLREEYGTFRREARVVQMSSDSMTIPRRAGGLTAYFTGENTSITESQKSWDQVSLVAKKLACLTRMSTELGEDAAINVADDLAKEMAYAFAAAEDDAGWQGDGTSTDGGILGMKQRFVAGLASFVGAVDLTSGIDTLVELTTAQVFAVMSVLPRYAHKNAKFYMSNACWVHFQRLLAAGGGNTIDTLTGAATMSWMGYPVVTDQTLPIGGTINDIPMFYFGDLSLAARMGSRRGISVKVSEDRFLEYDQIAIQATERFDIVVHDIGDASTAGPIVAAMGNT
jgi:HK97 family phage major capsid protein